MEKYTEPESNNRLSETWIRAKALARLMLVRLDMFSPTTSSNPVHYDGKMVDDVVGGQIRSTAEEDREYFSNLDS